MPSVFTHVRLTLASAHATWQGSLNIVFREHSNVGLKFRVAYNFGGRQSNPTILFLMTCIKAGTADLSVGGNDAHCIIENVVGKKKRKKKNLGSKSSFACFTQKFVPPFLKPHHCFCNSV